MSLFRPQTGGDVPLDDEDLAGIGLAVVYESGAKLMTGCALRALAALDFEQWKKTERYQFSQLIEKLEPNVEELADTELKASFKKLREALAIGHELRHIVVHVTWGHSEDGFAGYDYGRSRKVSGDDIRDAVQQMAEIKQASHRFAMRVAELVAQGVIEEREPGPGVSVLTEFGSARL